MLVIVIAIENDNDHRTIFDPKGRFSSGIYAVPYHFRFANGLRMTGEAFNLC